MSIDGWLDCAVGELLNSPPRNGYSPREVDGWTGTLMLGLGCLTESGFKPKQLKNAPASDPRLREALLTDGDLLISRSNTRDRVGYVGRFESIGVPCIYPDLMMRLLPGPRVDSVHLERALQSPIGRRQIEAAAVGTSGSMVKINRAVVEGLRVPLPPIPEQRRIAEILDTLDEAIRKTDLVIAKLQQVKQGLLHDLLTRGIDEHGELRNPERHPEQFEDSPLGRIPRGWETQRLERLLDGIDAGKSPSLEDTPASLGEWGILKVSAVRPDGFQSVENKVVRDRRHVREADEVRDGDLLITRANTYELVGLTCLVKRPQPQLMLCDKTLRLRVSAGTKPSFVFYTSQMAYVRRQIEVNATGSSGSMKNISQSAINGLLLAVPETREQSRIVAALDAATRRIEDEKEGAAKLRTLKQGLMDDLLTGRVRVPIPDETRRDRVFRVE